MKIVPVMRMVLWCPTLNVSEYSLGWLLSELQLIDLCQVTGHFSADVEGQLLAWVELVSVVICLGLKL